MPAFGYKPTTVTKTGGDDKKVVTPVVPNAITPFNLSIADLYIIILPKAELLYIKGDLSVIK